MCQCHGNGMRCIPADILRKLPSGGWFERFDKTIVTIPNQEKEVFEKKWVNTIVWSWIDPMYLGARTAQFDLRTGEYLEEV